MDLKKKKSLAQKRIWRIRKKVRGSKERPRLCVHFSKKHIYAQAIDDDEGKTLIFLSTLSRDLRKENLKANVESAARLGKIFSEKAKTTGLAKVVFDRNGNLYHGAVKAFAEAARENGLRF